MRSYLELDMYTSLIVHTESTLAAGRAELLVFERLLHVIISLYFCMYMPYSDIESRITKLWTRTRIGISQRLTRMIMSLTTSKTKGWHGVSTRNPMRRPTDRWKPFTYSILTLRTLRPRYCDLPTWPSRWLWLFFTDTEMQRDGSCRHDHPHKDRPTR